ncbi:ClpP/crotonase [Leucogyrophana mollusca]|uniref:ClpP/crotonase n=1 Tax=Leucogyrophana mollusca TaxID=85980 RepID=A0ACB8B6Y9_9AGAM|nr:ClpP/crotonase [Leucogyrophana mollusca]
MGRHVKVSSPSPHVRHVELERQPVNAFTEEFWMEYAQTFDDLSKLTDDVRVIVLSSALPKIFTAGIDFQGLKRSEDDLDPARRAIGLRDHILHFQHAISAPERCPVPVIAAVHGAVIGLGVDIISACDIRYAAQGTRFSVKEVDLGLAADIGTLARLPKIAGNQSLVREFSYTGRPFLSDEAEKLGLISRVVEGGRDAVVQAALQLAKEIALKSPVAVAGTKQLLLHARDHSVDQNLEYTATWNAAMLQAEDLKQAVQAGVTKAKGPPAFRSLRPARSKL